MNLILVVGFIGRTKVSFRVFTLLGRVAARAGLVTRRQIFVRRSHGMNCPRSQGEIWLNARGFARKCEGPSTQQPGWMMVEKTAAWRQRRATDMRACRKRKSAGIALFYVAADEATYEMMERRAALGRLLRAWPRTGLVVQYVEY